VLLIIYAVGQNE